MNSHNKNCPIENADLIGSKTYTSFGLFDHKSLASASER